MNIEKRHKIATLMSAIARVPGFGFEGYEEGRVVKELTQLASAPDLSMYALKLDQKWKKGDDFALILRAYEPDIENGREYIEIFIRSHEGRKKVLAGATDPKLGPNPFDDPLPSVMSVMSHIEVERQG